MPPQQQMLWYWFLPFLETNCTGHISSCARWLRWFTPQQKPCKTTPDFSIFFGVLFVGHYPQSSSIYGWTIQYKLGGSINWGNPSHHHHPFSWHKIMALSPFLNHPFHPFFGAATMTPSHHGPPRNRGDTPGFLRGILADHRGGWVSPTVSARALREWILAEQWHRKFASMWHMMYILYINYLYIYTYMCVIVCVHSCT